MKLENTGAGIMHVARKGSIGTWVACRCTMVLLVHTLHGLGFGFLLIDLGFGWRY